MAGQEEENVSHSRIICSVASGRRVHKHDSGWAWLVGVCGCLCNVFTLGCSYSFGVMYPSLLDEFKRGKAQTAWIGSLCMSLTFFFGPLAGKLCDHYGPRAVIIIGAIISVIGLATTSQARNIFVLYLTYSVIFAFGGCCIYTSVFVIVPKYFLKHRSLATGMIAAGPGAGTFIMSPILARSIEGLGWRGAFLVMAGIIASVCLLGCAFDPNSPTNPAERDVCHAFMQDKKKRHLSRNPSYLLLVFVTAIVILGNSVPQVHMARYCEEKGISLQLASTLYLVLGLCSVFARVLVGRLCDCKFVDQRCVYQGCLFVLGFSTLLCPLANTFPTLLVYFIMFGLFDGGQSTVANVLVLTSVQEGQKARAFGLWLFCLSVIMACGPPLAGYIADSTGSYAPAFYLAGSSIVTGASAFFVMYFLRSNAEEMESQTKLVVIEKVTVV
ncbi:monocarboxylate transporter 12-like [Stylophora pistillata]|uniref:monocarboxylate transporter 12-like n=1 Tax=Stylophora pistillata TaxID=50429 RepID=UPI000C048294|nr:monocarboxylate transporter 12-like [Stylophora pistillata]